MLPKTLEKLKSDPRIASVYEEDNDMDGSGRPDYWVEMATGYANLYMEPGGGLHSIHEQSVRYIMQQMKRVGPCPCKDCENFRKDEAARAMNDIYGKEVVNQ